MSPFSNQSPARRRVATVGTFDGLHKGHQRVLATLKALAVEKGLEPLVITFDRHPLETLAPQKAPCLIQSPSRRTNALYSQGFSQLVLEFTPRLASMSAREWMQKMHEEQRVDCLVVGYDNTFGSDGMRMSLADYHRLGSEVGVDVVEADYEPRAGSSAIRKLISEGLLDEACALLGRRFEITGEVVAGKQLGRRLGFPTANVRPAYRAQFPLSGVYAVEVELPDGTRRPGVANVGTAPTVGEAQPAVALEVHIPGFSGDLYGERLTVTFVRRLRDERKFDSLDALKAQIALDVQNLNSISKSDI